MAKRWIDKAIRKPGSFREQAKRSNMSTRQYAEAVLSGTPTTGTPSGNYNRTTVRRARLAKQLAGYNRKRDEVASRRRGEKRVPRLKRKRRGKKR